MNLSGRVKLVSQLLDLPIIDKDEQWCGIVDDVELEVGARMQVRVKALLTGPGAYEGRMPAWIYFIVRRLAGDRIVRVPAEEIAEIGPVVKLKSRADQLKLNAVEEKLRQWIPRVGAM
ncbi:MAG TPA: hypothetical protein VE968_05025 [Sphingomicrobium sp.]|nr:hypothetical protein [Sphingomicrobium sp.]